MFMINIMIMIMMLMLMLIMIMIMIMILSLQNKLAQMVVWNNAGVYNCPTGGAVDYNAFALKDLLAEVDFAPNGGGGLCQSVSQSDSQSVSLSVSPSVSQSVSESVGQ